MRLLKILVLLLAISGVAALVLSTRGSARPLTAISAIDPAMNFAYVRIQGLVTDYPSYSEQDGYLSFYVRDTSGIIRVTAYRTTTNTLVATKRVPMPGNQVAVEGTLRVREDEPSLTVNSPEALELNTPEASVVELAALDSIPVGGRVQLTAQVRKFRDTTAAVRIVTLRDNDQEVDMVLPLNLSSIFGTLPSLAVGNWIQVTACVGEYRGQRQLLPSSASGVTLVVGHPLKVRTIASLSNVPRDQWVAVSGSVKQLRKTKTGMLIDIGDVDGAGVTIAMFDNWIQVPFSQTLAVGNQLTVQGKLSAYNGQIEIQPELGSDLVRGP